MKNTLRTFSFYFLVIGLFLFGTFLGNRTVAVISENTPVPRDRCFVIDAGHGGEDGGAYSCTGRSESDYNLEIALRLDDLMHLLGMDTLMIRKTDISVYTAGETIAQKKVSDLKERVRLVNRTDNGILLSIHQNQFSDERYSGAQVFYGKQQDSQELAKTLQEKMIDHLNPGSHRQIKQGSGIYLLEKIQQPGVLIECGFLSNPQEEQLLRTPEYQKKLCCVIAVAVSGFELDPQKRS